MGSRHPTEGGMPRGIRRALAGKLKGPGRSFDQPEPKQVWEFATLSFPFADSLAPRKGPTAPRRCSPR